MKKTYIAIIAMLTAILTGCGTDNIQEVTVPEFEAIESIEVAPQTHKSGIIVLKKEDIQEEATTETSQEEIIEVELDETDPLPEDLEYLLPETEEEDIISDTQGPETVTYEDTEENIDEVIVDKEPEYTEVSGDWAAMYDQYIYNMVGTEAVEKMLNASFNGNSVDELLTADNRYLGYILLGQPSMYGTSGYSLDENETIVGANFTTMSEDERHLCINKIADTYKVRIYDTEEETIRHTWERIHNVMAYNLSYTEADMRQCIDGERGVCWTYSQIARTLLVLEGIPARTVSGYYGSESHCWVQAYVNGQWINLEGTDPTAFINDFSGYDLKTTWI